MVEATFIKGLKRLAVPADRAGRTRSLGLASGERDGP